MSVKAMVFVDGSWLYHNRKTIVNVASTDDFEIDYEKLPHLIAEVLGDKLDIDVDIVRTCYFGVIAINKPGYNPTKQRAFYDYLSERCYFETELHSIDFRQPPTSRLDERCVEIALASSMMYYAAMPGAFDVAVLITGDSDFSPLARTFKQDFPGKEIRFAFPFARASKELKQICPDSFTISKDAYAKHQLPDQVRLPSCKYVSKPDAWS